MQALLSFEQAPPIGAPLRFFLTAPLFAMLAGALLLWSGPGLLVSRWSPAALALTHLITAGFMLQVMLGALQQLLPVVAGANIAQPQRIATLVHAAITPGALLLVAGFLTGLPQLFGAAFVLLGAGVLLFVVAAARALYGVPGSSPLIRGFRLALVGLAVTVGLGLTLLLVLTGVLGLALVSLTNLHVGWGFVAWGCALLGAAGFVAVPMFQQTPEYPGWFGRGFAYAALGLVLCWSAAELAGWVRGAALLAVGVVLVAVVFALTTLHLQRRSKRAKFAATQRFWQIAMLSALAGCLLWGLARALPALDAWAGWPLLFGTLLLFGSFMSVMVGMLYKIVPFLIWLHLQNRGRGRLKTPNMKQVLAEKQIDRQMLAHFAACALLVLAVFWPTWFVYPAGLALLLANAWLLRNLLLATAVYRQQLKKIAALAPLAPLP
jgi:hypothetical protein